MTKIPNNPMQAYLTGKRHGRQDNFNLVAMALLDKCGFHVKQEGPEDTMSIEGLYRHVDEYIDEINGGRIKLLDVREMLAGDYSVAFRDKEGEAPYDQR